MKKILRLPIFILVTCGLMSCGVAKRTVKEPAAGNHSRKAKSKSQSHKPESHSLPPPAYATSAYSVSKYKEIEVSLRQAYRDWEGTPYVWGGESPAGVDCSGFMQLLFRQYFGVKLPRTTRQQLYAGKFVQRNDLKSGDLVFFDTGAKELHVGVIVDGSNFLNASTSQGVTISSLQDQYWNSHYMTARRVMEF